MSSNYIHEGKFVSIWLGQFDNPRDAFDYVDTLYDLEEDQVKQHFSELNISRAGEEDERDWLVEIGRFNQFRYDFLLYFDEDFCEVNALKNYSKDIYHLIGPTCFSIDYIKSVEAQYGRYLEKDYNVAIVLFDQRYEKDGEVRSVQHPHAKIDYLGCFSMVNEFKDFVPDYSITIGDRVKHIIYGKGTVIETTPFKDDFLLQIDFDMKIEIISDGIVSGFCRNAPLTKL